MKTTTTAKHHGVEYLCEAAGLALFMVSASAFATLLEHPSSPIRQALPDALTRRALMGLAMGLTAIILIYYPGGQRSGAHYNPAVTLTFFRLGKVSRRDLAGYIAAQFIGGAFGMAVASLALGPLLANVSVSYVATLPGMQGILAAFAAELLISALLMSVVLTVSNQPLIARHTGLCAGVCVALFITFEAPLSGMSMNPARTVASALAAHDWTALWIYFLAPPIGMLLAATIYTTLKGRGRVACAKLQHSASHRCIFCEYQRTLIPQPNATIGK